MNLTLIKGRQKGAQTGHSLLKKKVDALKKRFRVITGKIAEAKHKMGRIMQLAAFSLAESLILLETSLIKSKKQPETLLSSSKQLRKTSLVSSSPLSRRNVSRMKLALRQILD